MFPLENKRELDSVYISLGNLKWPWNINMSHRFHLQTQTHTYII